MTKIIATFSNGHSDEYKGKRDVKGAWMVTKSDGSVFASGHSADVLAAGKTANASIPRLHQTFTGVMTPGYSAHIMKHYVRPAGFSDVRRYNTFAKAENAANAAKFKIEIIQL